MPRDARFRPCLATEIPRWTHWKLAIPKISLETIFPPSYDGLMPLNGHISRRGRAILPDSDHEAIEMAMHHWRKGRVGKGGRPVAHHRRVNIEQLEERLALT